MSIERVPKKRYSTARFSPLSTALSRISTEERPSSIVLFESTQRVRSAQTRQRSIIKFHKALWLFVLGSQNRLRTQILFLLLFSWHGVWLGSACWLIVKTLESKRQVIKVHRIAANLPLLNILPGIDTTSQREKNPPGFMWTRNLDIWQHITLLACTPSIYLSLGIVFLERTSLVKSLTPPSKQRSSTLFSRWNRTRASINFVVSNPSPNLRT